MRTVWLTLDLVGLAATLTFIAMYATSAPTWHRSIVGRTLMANAAVLSGLLALVVIGNVFGSTLPRWIWVAGMTSFDLVLWVQVWNLWRVNRSERKV